MQISDCTRLFAVIAHYRYAKLCKSTSFVISTDGRNLSQVVGIYSKAANSQSLTIFSLSQNPSLTLGNYLA